MADNERLGTIDIVVDRAWDISDLLALSEGLADSYGFFYPLVAIDDEIRGRLHDQLSEYFGREKLRPDGLVEIYTIKYQTTKV